jgi:hypothetical protein
MLNITSQQIDQVPGGTSYKGSHRAPKAHTWRPPIKAQQLALAMGERMVLINAEVRPSLYSRDVFAVYGESGKHGKRILSD